MIFSIVAVIERILRTFLLRLSGVKIGKNCKINGKIYLYGDRKKLTIGNNCSINHGVTFQMYTNITIGNEVHISPYAQFYTGKLNLEASKRKVHEFGPILLNDNVWIAANVIVSANVEIGKNSVVGAHSFVNSSLPNDVLATGCPARVIKSIEQ